MKKLLFLIICLSQLNFKAQETFPVNGAPYRPHTVYALVNANIQIDPDHLIMGGTLVYKDGKILEAGDNKIVVPKEAVIRDMKGAYIYPSFIDIYSDYGMPEIKPAPRMMQGPQMESSIKGAFGWNQAIRSEVDASKLFVHQTEKADALRKSGFGIVLSFQKDGIVRGSGVLLNLDDRKENLSIVRDRSAAYYALNKGSSTQDYPSSLTGCIALLRQTYYDAQWYKTSVNKTEHNISLDAFNQLQNLPSVIEGNDKFNDLRASKIGNEFGVKYIIKGGGNEYQRAQEIAASGNKYILPLNFPETFDVEDSYEAENITLSELLHWELAPSNPGKLEKLNVPFCFTSSDLKNKEDFLKNLRKALQAGLSESMALKALTTNPASFIGLSDKIGTLKKGSYANFFICNAPVFKDNASISEHIVAGERKVYLENPDVDIRGKYELKLDSKVYEFTINGETNKLSGQVKIDTSKKITEVKYINGLLSFQLPIDSNNTFRASGNFDPSNKNSSGKGQFSNGSWVAYSITYKGASEEKKKPEEKKKNPELVGKVIYPFNAYGQSIKEETGTFKEQWLKALQPEVAVLYKNATIWTNEKDSLLIETDVLVANGKIKLIGKDLSPENGISTKVIDAKGKHLTPGIIDEHNHIAMTGGVNEGAQASSAEVRMGDIINPDDINIYRQLAGGVTCIQLLHGSANPIGGQSALIKLRWGQSADDLKYENADGFIKFALGENVKQSNWGDFNSVRFPQSRMGVEQVYMDYFTRAREYDKQWNTYKKTSVKDKNLTAPRRDLELDALAEILANKRFITCHSYVQSEINMLMHVADSFDFKVNTFTHILEGYKVADKMKKHGVNASTFADWWAYKNEVMEAIPHNAALLAKMGVNTSVNSDDAEMARRLNHEAAKGIKYGALSETEALKLVTLNPAKMLHIDDKTGSIKVGKSADLVLWSGHPLSVYSKVEKTMVDGVIYFDRDKDELLQEEINKERARLIAKMLKEKQSGSKTIKHRPQRPRLYHCNTLEGVSEEETGHR